MAWIVWGPLWFHLALGFICSVSVKGANGVLIGIALILPILWAVWTFQQH